MSIPSYTPNAPKYSFPMCVYLSRFPGVHYWNQLCKKRNFERETMKKEVDSWDMCKVSLLHNSELRTLVLSFVTIHHSFCFSRSHSP